MSETDTKYINDLIIKLDGILSITDTCDHLSTVFDSEWRTEILKEITAIGQKEVFQSEKGLLFFWYKENPLKLRDLESRLAAISSVTEFERRFNEKISLITRNKFNLSCRNHIFELSVLGAYAKHGLLLDMDIPVGGKGSTIDGLVCLDDREVFLEVTFTAQELYEIPKNGAIWMPLDDMVN